MKQSFYLQMSPKPLKDNLIIQLLYFESRNPLRSLPGYTELAVAAAVVFVGSRIVSAAQARGTVTVPIQVSCPYKLEVWLVKKVLVVTLCCDRLGS